jgi:YidC/Oxa1 family membrane protein insertase
MTDVRRMILWGVFVVSLMMLWDGWNRHNGQPSLFGPPGRPAQTQAPAGAPANAAATPATQTAAVNATAAATGVPQPAAATAAVNTPAASALATTAPPSAAQGEAVTITTDVMRATFDSRGAQLVKLELLKHQVLAHQDPANAGQPVLLFERSADREYLAQSGLISSQAGVVLPTHQTLMRATGTARAMAEGENTFTLTFESAEPAAARLVKTFTFERGSYAVAVKHEVTNTSGAPLSPQLYLQLARDAGTPKGESSMYLTFTGPAVYSEAKKFSKIEFKDIDKGKGDYERRTDNGWIGMVQHYFASAWIPPQGESREIQTRKDGGRLYAITSISSLGELAPGASKAHVATLYAGPQEENKLAQLAPGLELVKDYGWFRMLSSPLFWLLDKLHGLLGNWGWAIVALVVLLKAAFYGLNASAYRSMAKMKAVGPRVQELRERYKDKPQVMQQEMMRIYREEKVNPLGGCLPIVAQMPFFIALYWVLLSSAEMRNAPWIGWIKDLSAPDTLFGVIPWINMPVGPLPILMTLSSLLQVKLGAQPPDPLQARMMWMMPLIFGVMFFFFPAGLVLYWLTNNLLSIAQQWSINKRMGVTH